MTKEVGPDKIAHMDFNEMSGKERLKEIRTLGNIVFKKEGNKLYMNSSHKGFKDKTPVQMIKEGNEEAVLRDLAGLYEGQGF